MNDIWKDRQRARGLTACPCCNGTGCILTPKLAAAFDPANDGRELPSIDETFCPTCAGLGWLRIRQPAHR